MDSQGCSFEGVALRQELHSIRTTVILKALAILLIEVLLDKLKQLLGMVEPPTR